MKTIKLKISELSVTQYRTSAVVFSTVISSFSLTARALCKKRYTLSEHLAPWGVPMKSWDLLTKQGIIQLSNFVL